MIKSIKVRLKPTRSQLSLFKQSVGTHRFIYNWVLHRQNENYKNGQPFLHDGVLRKEITQLKKTDGFKWLGDVSNDIPKQAVKDACHSFIRFFKGQSRYPRFKKKGRTRESFYCDTVKTKIDNNRVYLSKIGWVRTSEMLPSVDKIKNPRVSFDNKYWYLSFAYEHDVPTVELTDEVLGIDLGLQSLAVISNGEIVENINYSQSVKYYEKKLRRLQRKCSRKYEHNKTKKGKFVKTCNIYKIEKQIRLIHRKLRNIRLNHIHQLTSYVVKTKPREIVIEDLNVTGMMKNKHLSKSISGQLFYEIRRKLEYKSNFSGIKLTVANRFFPSTQMCSGCGNIKRKDEKMTLKDREYQCKQCGYVGDRDVNASLNLKHYPTIIANSH